MTKTIICDIDGTICHGPKGQYDKAEPDYNVIRKINTLYEQGNTIVLYTARGTVSGINWRSMSEKQLHKWGVKYHKLLFGKPHYDLWVDDICINVHDWMKE